MKLYIFCLSASSLIHFVFIGILPAGSSSIIETSRSPYIVSASERGIGVALITIRLARLPFSLRSFLWVTPNLCCSSIIINPRFLNTTSFSMRACVPMTMSTSPFSISARSFSLFFPFTLPVSSSTLTSRFINSSTIPR